MNGGDKQMETLITIIVLLAIALLVCIATILEQSITIKTQMKSLAWYINQNNEKHGLPSMNVTDLQSIESVINSLEDGDGYLDLAGYAKNDKKQIEALKKALYPYIPTTNIINHKEV